MFERLKNEFINLIYNSILKLKYNYIKKEDIIIETSKYSDCSTNISFIISRIENKNPSEISKIITDNIDFLSYYYIDNIKSIGPYINCYSSKKFIDETINKILIEKENYGIYPKNKNIVLEHTSANPNGPLHIGHLRNSIIGDTLSRILKRNGYNVETQYYVNDIGRQIAIVVWAYDKFHYDKTMKSDHSIADIYIKANKILQEKKEYFNDIDQLMKKVENGDLETKKKFDFVVNLALNGIKETLSLMNIKHDKFIFESKFICDGSAYLIVKQLKENNRIINVDGSLSVDLSPFGINKNMIIQRSNGTSLYITRDIAYHKWKSNNFDDVIDILGSDHKLISSQLKIVLKLLKLKVPKVVIFEFVSLPDGSMSTRNGKFISVDDVIKKVQEKALQEIEKRKIDYKLNLKEEISNSVALAAIRYDMIRVSSDKSTIFDWKYALNFDKKGGPYLLYAYARASNIILKVRENFYECEEDYKNISDYLINENEINLIKKLAQFTYIIELCSINLKPSLLVTYANELVELFNQFYQCVPVISTTNKQLKIQRLKLVRSFKIILYIVLETLGIKPLEKM